MKAAYYDDAKIAEAEARPASQPADPQPRRPLERWRRIAEQSQPCVLSNGGYSYTQHLHDREGARRLRQMERRGAPA